jgi:hypothetical protein
MANYDTNFSTNSLGDVLIFSGFDLGKNHVNKISSSPLKGAARTQALDAASASYVK